jgi:hypothetical protein
MRATGVLPTTRLGTAERAPICTCIALQHGGYDMQAMDIQEQARRLREARGDLALAQAAQKARDCEQHGDTKQAETWRRIEAALRQMQGPRVS